MQTLVQAICKKGRSLRETIAGDKKLEKFGLTVTEHHRPRRAHGWAKLHSTRRGRRGAINVEWDQDTNILLCRVITRGTRRPNPIVGDFVDYLLRRWHRRINAINIIPR